jgi:hypothetical protein
MRFNLTRDFYIPKGSRKVAHKHSDAVAYVYNNASGKPCAAIFFGKQAKPVAQFRYRDEGERERSVTDYFQRRQDHAQRVAEARKSPPGTATRNAAIKRVLEAKYGKGSVSVTGDRGTAYGWVNVRFSFPKPTPPGNAYPDAKGEVVRLLEANGIKLGYYDSADYGSGDEIAIQWAREN